MIPFDSFLFSETALNLIHINGGIHLDWFMERITGTGSKYLFITAIPLLYWTNHRVQAVKIGIFLIATSALADIAKGFFASPRPNPDLLDRSFSGLAEAHGGARGFGFPSGTSQRAISFWWGIMHYSRELFSPRGKYLAGAAVFFIIAVPFSRIHLGAHYIGDVLGSFFLVGVSGMIFFPAVRRLEKNFSQKNSMAVAAAAMGIPLLLAVAFPGGGMSRMLGTVSGFLMGAWWDYKLHPEPMKITPLRLILFMTAGFTLLLLIKILLKEVFPSTNGFHFVRYWLMGAWISLGAPFLFRRIRTP